MPYSIKFFKKKEQYKIMKKLIFTMALLVSMFQFTNAQEAVSENKMVLGGSFNFLVQNNAFPLSSFTINSGIGGIYSNTTEDSKNTTFAFTPYLAKELKPQLLVGFQLDYRVANYWADNTVLIGQPNLGRFERNSNQIGFGLFTRHMLNPEKSFIFFLQPYFDFNFLNEEVKRGDDLVQKEKANYLELGVGIGLLYNINDRIRAIVRTGGINYVRGNWKIEDTDVEKDFSSFGTSINLTSVFFGFEVRL